MRISLFVVFGFVLTLLNSCENAPVIAKAGELDVLPYVDKAGFVEGEISKLGNETVRKTTRINGKEEATEVTLSQEEWREELDAFFKADINKPSMVTAYSTEVNGDVLLHRLQPGEKSSIKEIKVRIIDDRPIWVTFKISKENFFYTSTIIGEIYMNQRTQKIDHYSIETTQKIMFLDANNLRIKGAVQP